MYPFLAFLWTPSSGESSATAAALLAASQRAASPWDPVFKSEGLVLLTRPSRAVGLRVYRLPACGGIILGRLFPTDLGACAPGWEPRISVSDLSRYLGSSGRQLTQDYWGAYIAFLYDQTDSHSLVVRDPSGKLPCYRLHHLGVEVLFADVSDLLALQLPPLTPNLRYLAASIHQSSLQIRETALEEVTELLAGEGFEKRGATGRQSIVWDPQDIFEGPRESNFEQAAGRLRRVTQSCIDAWACVHPRVLHRLSGGLDSSIVLGCLSLASPVPSIVCLNHYIEDAAGDERRYARITAARAGVRLLEIAAHRGALVLDEQLLAMPPSVKPDFAECARLMQAEAMNSVAERHRVDAVWTGQGGDHLFLSASNVPSAADFISDRGVRWNLARVVHDEAHRSLRPYTWVLKSLIAPTPSHERIRSAAPGALAVQFVDTAALPKTVDRYSVHPWMLAAKELPAGRRRQIELLADIVNRHRSVSASAGACEHHPLLSQPIVEQCLRTPTYLHLQDGRQRSLARYAFRDCVPPQILEREDKGETTRFTVEGLRRSKRFLRELLLDGRLVREHVLARGQLETCLRDGQPLIGGQLPPLLACIAAEVWIRAWQRTA